MRSRYFSLESRTTPVSGREGYNKLRKSLSSDRGRNGCSLYSPVGCKRKYGSINREPVPSVCSSWKSCYNCGGNNCGDTAGGDGGGGGVDAKEFGGTSFRSFSPTYSHCADLASSAGSDSDESGRNVRPQATNCSANTPKSDATMMKGYLSFMSWFLEKVKNVFSWKSFQPMITFWPSYSAYKNKYQIDGKNRNTADKHCCNNDRGRPVRRVTHSSRMINSNPTKCSCTPRDVLVGVGDTLHSHDCNFSSNLRGEQMHTHRSTSQHIAPSPHDGVFSNDVTTDAATVYLHEDCDACPTNNLENLMQTTATRSKSSPTGFDPYLKGYDFCKNDAFLQSGPAPSRGCQCHCRQNQISRWPPFRYDELACAESPADRLVGLTIHCVILSIAVVVAILSRWTVDVLKFLLYLALHTAVYKGRISPLREDIEEAVTQEQLRDATMFDSTGLKIILLQYRPPPRHSIEYSNSSGLVVTTELSAETTRSESYPEKSITNRNSSSSSGGPSSNSDRKTGGLKKSISTHSGSSQDLSHIFSNTSSSS